MKKTLLKKCYQSRFFIGYQTLKKKKKKIVLVFKK